MNTSLKLMAASTLLLPLTALAKPVFTIAPLSKQQKQYLIDHKLWNKDCPVAMEQLRALQVTYYDFKGKQHNDGLVVVIEQLAKPTLKIFKKLYQQKFPMHKVALGSQVDDLPKHATSYTSSYNCRKIRGDKNYWSLHSYGAALDINPTQNPFLRITDPENGIIGAIPVRGVRYLNRTNQRPGMVEPIVKLFQKNKFERWGGHWNTPVDYQHFQTTRKQAEDFAKTAKKAYPTGEKPTPAAAAAGSQSK